MADRIGVINKGEIILVEDKAGLMQKLGKKRAEAASAKQDRCDSRRRLRAYNLELSDDGREVTYNYDTKGERTGITSLLSDLRNAGIRILGPRHQAEFAGRHLRQPGEGAMNFRAVRAIYLFEMARTWRTLLQSIVSPVVSTSLYFVVFGAAIGSRITEVEGVSYGTFIVPGLVMLSVLTQSIANASFGIYFPKFVGTIYEILSAPISYFEIVLGYVGAAATKSIILGLIILATAGLFVPLHIHHPWWMLTFLVLTAVTFSLFGFIIGIWADGFEKLQMIPMLVVTPLTFLGGSFYSVNMLPSGWRTITLLNPVVYLISGFRWSFYEIADVSVGLSVGMTLGFLVDLHGHGVVDLQDRIPAEELTRRWIVVAIQLKRHSGAARRAEPGNLEIPGLVLADHPGMTFEKLPVTPEMAVAIVITAAAIAAIRNPEHALDCAHGAADAGSDRAANHATYGAGDPVTFVGALLRAAHDALGVADMRDRQQRKDDGGRRKPEPERQACCRQRCRLDLFCSSENFLKSARCRRHGGNL